MCITKNSKSVPVVPKSDSVLINLILKELHSGVLGGHVGAKKLLKLV